MIVDARTATAGAQVIGAIHALWIRQSPGRFQGLHPLHFKFEASIRSLHTTAGDRGPRGKSGRGPHPTARDGTDAPSSVWRRTGAGREAASSREASPGCSASLTSKRRTTPIAFLEGLEELDLGQVRGSTSLTPKGQRDQRWSRVRRAIDAASAPCTPRSATTASAPRSTADLDAVGDGPALGRRGRDRDEHERGRWIRHVTGRQLRPNRRAPSSRDPPVVPARRAARTRLKAVARS